MRLLSAIFLLYVFSSVFASLTISLVRTVVHTIDRPSKPEYIYPRWNDPFDLGYEMAEGLLFLGFLTYVLTPIPPSLLVMIGGTLLAGLILATLYIAWHMPALFFNSPKRAWQQVFGYLRVPTSEQTIAGVGGSDANQ